MGLEEQEKGFGAFLATVVAFASVAAAAVVVGLSVAAIAVVVVLTVVVDVEFDVAMPVDEASNSDHFEFVVVIAYVVVAIFAAGAVCAGATFGVTL